MSRASRRSSAVEVIRAPRPLQGAHASGEKLDAEGGKAALPDPPCDERFLHEACPGAVEDHVGSRGPSRLRCAKSGSNPSYVEAAAHDGQRSGRQRSCAAGSTSRWFSVSNVQTAFVDSGGRSRFRPARRRHWKDVQIGPQRRHLAEQLQPPRLVDVVPVQESHEVSGRGSGGRVLGSALTTILLPDHDDPVAKRLESGLQLVGRAVIADDDLQWGRCLLECRPDRVRNERRYLIGGDDDREGPLCPRRLWKGAIWDWSEKPAAWRAPLCLLQPDQLIGRETI